jgi:hypothetical protein
MADILTITITAIISFCAGVAWTAWVLEIKARR